jgi:hypothetical protein
MLEAVTSNSRQTGTMIIRQRRTADVHRRSDQEMVVLVAYARTATEPQFVANPNPALPSFEVGVLRQSAKPGTAGYTQT